MTAYPGTDERSTIGRRPAAAERMRARAWRLYLESTRRAEDYEPAEERAWERLQDRLAAIDDELWSAADDG